MCAVRSNYAAKSSHLNVNLKPRCAEFTVQQWRNNGEHGERHFFKRLLRVLNVSVLLINRFFSWREDFVLPRSQSAGAGKTIGQASLGTSPSPRPSPGGRPGGRGRTGGVTCSNRSSLRSQQESPQRRSCTARSRSPNALSLRERVGVRGRRSARKSPNAKTSGAPHMRPYRWSGGDVCLVAASRAV